MNIPPTYNMHVENEDGSVTPHPYHLGTDLKMAETIVLERLANTHRPCISIALRWGSKLNRIYDHRDLNLDEGFSPEMVKAHKL